jgi:hypothetical protein
VAFGGKNWGTLERQTNYCGLRGVVGTEYCMVSLAPGNQVVSASWSAKISVVHFIVPVLAKGDLSILS